ncbi:MULTISPECIES: hypothetical protein [unclassified Streptomyces]|uniref:hypothetical protein n=1 Tax=unclassified Streptomyces TaxID=2593676 RepID=UPI00336A5FAC
MRVPRDRPPHAPEGGGRGLVIESVNLGLGHDAGHPLADLAVAGAFPGALAAPLIGGLAAHPTA